MNEVNIHSPAKISYIYMDKAQGVPNYQRIDYKELIDIFKNIASETLVNKANFWPIY